MGLSPEHKEKIRLGREKALAEKKAANADIDVAKSDNAVDKAKPNRPVRKHSLADAQNIMTVEGTPDGYKGRWVNDTGNQVLKRRELGYEFTLDSPDGRIAVGDKGVDPNRQTGSVVSKIVGTDKTGKPLVSYWMVQRLEWYDDDQAFKQKQIDEKVKGLYEQADKDGLNHGELSES